MNLLRVVLKSFKSYGPNPQTLDLTNADAVSVGGNNGSGKSSIIEALTFALYGKATATETRELGDDALINDRAREAYVSVSFEKDGNTYTVERTIVKRGVGKARLMSPVLEQPIADARAVNAKLQSLLGMDYETFVSSTIIRQDEMDRLSSKRPAERKEILSSIFGLQAYEAMREKAHEKAWVMRKEIAGLEAAQKSLEERISLEGDTRTRLSGAELKIAALEKERSDIEASRKEVEAKLNETREAKAALDAMEGEKRALREQMGRDALAKKEAEDLVLGAEKAQERLIILMDELRKRDKLAEKLQRLFDEREKLRIEVAKWEQNARALEVRVNEETDNYAMIEGYAVAECPVCKRPLDEQHRALLIEEYKQRIAQLAAERKRCVEKGGLVQEDLADRVGPDIEKTQRAMKEFEELERQATQLKPLADDLPRHAEQARSIREYLENRQKRIDELERLLTGLEPTLRPFEKLDQKWRELDRELSIVQGNVGREEANRDRLLIDLRDIDEAKSRLRELVQQLGDRSRLARAYEILEKEVFHKDGIPTALLMEIVPEVESEASRTLRALSNGRMDISFRFGRTTKTGKLTDELIVEAVDQGRSHPVSRYSGGERMRINLALRLGVSEVVARRGGEKGRIETLVMDEGFGSLDEEGRKAALEILQVLRQRFRRILVISHVEEVKEAFDSCVVVTKPVGGFSSITAL